MRGQSTTATVDGQHTQSSNTNLRRSVRFWQSNGVPLNFAPTSALDSVQTMNYANPSPHKAARRHGVCTGSLWKQIVQGTPSSSPSSGLSRGGRRRNKEQADDKTRKSYEFFVLAGVLLVSYSDYNAYMRGDHPVSVIKIVGASSWNTSGGGPGSDFSSQRNGFRLVSSRGVHYGCTAPTPKDSALWITCLHAGLEASYQQSFPEPQVLKPPNPRESAKRRGGMFREKATACQSCGRGVEVVTLSTPLPQYGLESRCFVCPECLVAQGVLLDVYQRNQLYACHLHEKNMIESAKTACFELLQKKSSTSKFGGAATEANALRDLISSTSFGLLRRSCPRLEFVCVDFEHGVIDAIEFVEFLEDSKTDELIELKREAFLVAGDMGSAMKLLLEYTVSGEVDMLSHILGYFVKLCEEGEIESVSFFWPQFLGLHLQMLPPTDFVQNQRVELMEDFLLTIATRYSVQLALDLT